MTINVTVLSSKSYTGDGGTTAFPTTFVFRTSADIEVIERVIATGVETTQVLTTDYTVTGGGGAGAVPATGTVNAVTAPTSTFEWVIRRIVAEDQESALPAGGIFPSATVEGMSDSLTMQVQQHSEEFNRTLKNPKTDDSDLDMEIPNSVDRASKLLAFTATGAPTVRDLTSGGSGTLSNVVEDDTPQLGGSFDTNGHTVRWTKGPDVASAAVLPVPATGNFFDVTGTTTVTSINTHNVLGTTIGLQFDDALILTHNATNLILPGGANITTAAGDIFWFTEYASVDWVCVGYALASGRALAAKTPRFEVFTSSGTWTQPTDVTEAIVTVWGAGASGGGDVDDGGGGAGSYSKKRVTGISGNVTVTVGTGGAAVTTGDGNAGGASSFAASVTTNGGAANVGGTGGAGGAATATGDINIAGGDGSNNGTADFQGSLGGNAPFGGAGGFGPVSNVANAKQTAGYPGAGAGGTGSHTDGTTLPGADGCVIVEWME